MASNLRVDQITASTTGSVSIGTATFTGGLSGNITGLNVTGVITATTLNQNVTGVVTATGGFVVGTGASVYSPASNVLTLGTNNTEKVRIDSSGNFNLVNTAGIMTAFKYETPALINNHFKSQSTTAGAYVRMYAAAGSGQWDIYGNGANLRFSDNASSGNIQMDRPLSMNSQNIIMSSGYGIDFSATANSSGTTTSELLSDYEEGTWDSRPTTSTSSIVLPSGITNVSYNGTYVKIGSMVYLTGYFESTQTSADTSVLYLRLPFAVNGTSNMWSATGTETNRWDFGSGNTYVTVRPESGTSYATFKGCGSAAQRLDLKASNAFATANAYWLGMMMYRTS